MPGLNPCHAFNCDYFRSRFLVRADAIRNLPAPVARSASIRDVAVALLAADERGDLAGGAVHVPLPLVAIAESPTALADERAALFATDVPAVFLDREGRPTPIGPDKAVRFGRVSVVICTKDKGHLLRQLVRSLLRYPPNLLQEIVIVANSPTMAHAKQTLAAIGTEERVLVLDEHAPFNFSRLCNIGARRCSGEFLLFLNDDVVPVSETWLEEMLAPFADPRTGVTGPLLIYPDERTQHAGMYLGFNGVAGHTMRFARLPCQDYMFMGTVPRHVSCLTGAALLVRRSIFDDLNGFDEMFATYIQDVDFCLRALGAGYRLVFNPRAILIHMESVSVRATLDDPIVGETRGTEHRRYVERWNRLISHDPYHNPNFDLDDETLSKLRPGKRQAQRPVASHVAQDGI
jgi:GT2 family glycosyltransferase